ncbi:MAG: M24 family metallopeptidase [Alphaproteobacteria bacterium]
MSESAFPSDELSARRARVVAALAARGIDAMIVTGPENIFYLTGQQTPGYYTFQCLILAPGRDPIFILRQLEAANFAANADIADPVLYGDGETAAGVLSRVLAGAGLAGKRLAIEKQGWFVGIALYEQIVAAIGPLADGSGIIESARRVKSPRELAAIEKAAGYADAGMKAGIAAARDGGSENTVVAAMMGAMIAAGSEYLGMEPLVAAGERAGVPHATWRRRPIRTGDAVFLEVAGCHDRYHGAVLRTGFVGPAPTAALPVKAVAEEALLAGLAVLRPGNTCAAVHRAIQAVIDSAGMTDRYRKRSGYSSGISFAPDWGEWQVLSLFDGIDVPLEAGMCFHMPVVLREWGQFTVGGSETVIVTDTGWRSLSAIPRDLFGG